jgi:hypothetical protein
VQSECQRRLESFDHAETETLDARSRSNPGKKPMNPSSTALLTNPHPCGHIVYPYTDENLVEQAVCLFASAGIRGGEAVILIMTAQHDAAMKVRLQREGYDVADLERCGRLTFVTTEHLLARFMETGILNEELFHEMISRYIASAKASVTNGQVGKVRVFGEMVSQLRNADLTATTRLEELWNDVVSEHSVSLLCSYALHNPQDHIPASLIDLHSKSIETDTVTA